MRTITITGMTDEARRDIVRRTIAADPGRILALHVDERHFGAGVTLRPAFEEAGLDVQQLNQAYESHSLAGSLDRHADAAAVLPRIFDGQRLKVVYLTGWGSDPRSADALLKATYFHAAKRVNLRFVVLNNASPVPPMFTSAGPVAHGDPEEFAVHVATTAGVDREMVDLYVLERDDPDD